VPFRLRQRLARQHEGIGKRRFVDPESEGIDQHQLLHQMRRDHRKLGREHAAQRMADDIDRSLAPRFDQGTVVQRHIEQIVHRLEPARLAKARRFRGRAP
jgi:hypothetical protein